MKRWQTRKSKAVRFFLRLTRYPKSKLKDIFSWRQILRIIEIKLLTFKTFCDWKPFCTLNWKEVMRICGYCNRTQLNDLYLLFEINYERWIDRIVTVYIIQSIQTILFPKNNSQLSFFSVEKRITQNLQNWRIYSQKALFQNTN